MLNDSQRVTREPLPTEFIGEDTIRTYRDLRVWRKGMDLLEAVYQVAKVLPEEERYGLASQIRRSVASVPANIAEGHGRSHTRDILRHLYIARGSLAEVETYLLACERLGCVGDRNSCEAWETAQSTGRLLNGLVRSLEKRLSSIGPRSPITDHRSRG